jgi:hypothetical protein
MDGGPCRDVATGRPFRAAFCYACAHETDSGRGCRGRSAPAGALIPFEDYEALQEELDDLRAGRRGQAALEAWEKDRSLGQLYEEVRAEMVRDGLLDA